MGAHTNQRRATQPRKHADWDLKIFAKPKPQSLSSPALNGKRQDLEEKFKSELRKSQLWG